MIEQPRTRRVVVRCASLPPAERVRRAAGVSDVDVEGYLLRCRVTGSFQPFLEALLGSEVIDLATQDDSPPPCRPTDTPDGSPEVDTS